MKADIVGMTVRCARKMRRRRRRYNGDSGSIVLQSAKAFGLALLYGDQFRLSETGLRIL